MRYVKRFIQVTISCALAFVLTACGNYGGRGDVTLPAPAWATTKETEDTASQGDTAETEDTSQQVVPASEYEDGWTILVYICGSDLESGSYAASMDIDEMFYADTGSNVRFVIETGGAQEWYYTDISTTELDRFVISDGDIEYAGSARSKNMGTEEALEEFLIWGAGNYRSEHMGLVFWDHGSGSINGVCFDENYGYSSLLLTDISQALSAAGNYMGGKFDFIGFDACLMATLESAVQLAPYAEYMIGSQESEPGYGWNYTEIGDYLSEHTDADGEEIGIRICDSFYKDCAYIGEKNSCTLSVTDLGQIESVVDAFGNYALDLYNSAGNDKAISEVIRNIYSADNFGGNNANEGYTNMVDLGELIDAGITVSSEAEAARAAVENAVVYKIAGSDHKNASGLSVYYPLQLQGSMELRIFNNICVSPYYLGFVDKIAHGFAYGGSMDDYSNEDIINEDQGTDWSYVDDAGSTGDSSLITFIHEPQLDENGNFWFQLSPDGIDSAVSVQAMVFLVSSDWEDALCMGLSSDVYGDWETGIFEDDFDGYWFSLADGQVLCSYLVEECEGYDVYTSPILLNGEEKCLRFIWDYADNGGVYMVDVWDGMTDYGASGRTGNLLEVGDVITPLYDAFSIDTDEEFYYYGNEYTYDGDDSLWFDQLPDGDYFYCFTIDDIYGDYYMSDMAWFTIDGEDMYFMDELY